MKLKKFAPFAWGVLGWNLIVILWGAYVRATGSGAGCGQHWPLCNGQVLPQNPSIEMAIEFTHRTLSSIDLVLVAVMVFWGFFITQKGHHIRKGLIASGILIIVEALLGASLVLFKLVSENSSATRAFAVSLHLANTFLLIASIALTCYWASGGRPVLIRGKDTKIWLLGAGLLGMMLIGMSGAVTALGDTLFPVTSLAEGLAADADQNAHFLVRLRVYHPVFAVFIAIFSLYVVRLLYGKNQGVARKLLATLVIAGTTQLLLGLVNLLLLAPIPMQIIHLLSADTTWIIYVLTSAAILAIPQSNNQLEVL